MHISLRLLECILLLLLIIIHLLRSLILTFICGSEFVCFLCVHGILISIISRWYQLSINLFLSCIPVSLDNFLVVWNQNLKDFFLINGLSIFLESTSDDLLNSVAWVFLHLFWINVIAFFALFFICLRVHVLRIIWIFSLFLRKLEQSPALGCVDIKIRNHVNGSTCRVLKESLKFLHNFLPELFVCFQHVSTSFRDELKDLCIGHRRLN